jgi:hypothetical protein
MPQFYLSGGLVLVDGGGWLVFVLGGG